MQNVAPQLNFRSYHITKKTEATAILRN